MDSNKHNGRIPQLRFPGFEGEWEEKTLADICNITAGGDAPKQNFSKVKTGIYNVPVISNGIGENAIYGYTDIPKITQSAVTVAARGTIGYAEYRDYPYYPIIRLLSVIAKDSTIDTKYLSYLLSVQKYHSTDGGIPQLTVPMIGSTIIPIPSLLEQRTIAECLEAIDQMISAQNQKVESLKVHKKGLMQQLFPQPGATTPALRFPGFTGDWEVKKLGEIADVNPKSDKLPNKFVYIDLESVESGNLLKKNIIEVKNAPSRAQRLLKKGDILFQMVRPYQRNNYHFYDNDVNVYVASTGYAQIRYKDCSEYLYQYLHTDTFVDMAVSKCVGGNYPAINTTDLTNITVYLPSRAEQQMIAECLGTLDNLIAAESKKLGFLKSHKKGLMQQLFPQPEK